LGKGAPLSLPLIVPLIGITAASTAELTSATLRKIAVIRLILLMLFIVLIFFLVWPFVTFPSVPPSSRTRGLRRAKEKSFQAPSLVFIMPLQRKKIGSVSGKMASPR
jgi:hypothetical protein